MNWIKVSEILPENYEDVLVYCGDVCFARHYDGKFTVDSGDDGEDWEFQEVTHWMHLPQPPGINE